MSLSKFYFLLIAFLLMTAPGTIALAQESFTGTSEPTQMEEVNVKEKKKDKKKNKDAEYANPDVEINLNFFISLLMDVLTIVIIVRFIYYPNYHKQDVFFTYFLFNLAIFLLTFLLNKVKISMGAAFGLFAVFSMLRYRTEGISMKEMTYLFIVITVGLISAIQLTILELALINGLLIAFTFLLDGNILLRREFSKIINYENIEFIKAENHARLIEDLKQRTGLNIHKVSIAKIDFLRDMAVLIIYYYLPKKQKGEPDQPQVNYIDQIID
ncbi:MAG: DUF4956 domain-containing protein [Bacteroidota bacterium]